MAMQEAEVRAGYEALTKILIEKKLTITTMESCTCGQVASLITDTEGASAVLRGAFITYSNMAKILQGVPASVIETYGVYSEETAIAMADACRKVYDADLGIGITGSLGNVDPANRDSVPGQVYFAISNRQGAPGTRAWSLSLEPQPTRLAGKLAVAGEVLQAVLAQVD